MYKYVYGPVPSRRLGVSLGIDMVPYKTCSLNCVYCECGATTDLTLERKEYFLAETIISELRDFLSKNPMPEWLTLSGSGEPLLNSKTGYIIDTIKNEFPESKFAVLTNGTLLMNDDVRRELMTADLVLPSLDGATKQAFDAIDRPAISLYIDDVINGIAKFTKEFRAKDKQIWLEVFIIDGVNTDDKNIAAFREAFIKIQPNIIQLNTLDRPGTVPNIKPASKETLAMIQKKLDLPNVEIISKYKLRSEIPSYRRDIESAILEILRVRPCTVKDLADTLHTHINEINKYLEVLSHTGLIEPMVENSAELRGVFYKAKRD